MNNEFVVTEEWLTQWFDQDGKYLTQFKRAFPNNSKLSEVFEWCNKYNFEFFGAWLITKVPFNKEVLEIEYTNGHIFYNGDVHIKGDVDTDYGFYIIGNLIVDGNLSLKANGKIYAKEIQAKTITIKELADITGNVKAKIVNFKGGYIGRNVDVDADEIINDGGLIYGDVNTIKIENINGGTVDGKITYKRSDEHK